MAQRRRRRSQHVDVRGTAEGFLDAGGWQLRRGRFLSDLDHELGSDACVIGADIEDAFFKDQDPLGQRLKVGPTARCTVVGSLVRKGNAFGRSQDGLLVLPLSSFLRTFGARRGLTIAVVAPDGKVKETEDEVIAVMRAARRLGPDQDDNFSVNRQDKILQGFNQTMMATNVVGILVGVITAIVAGIGIMNILLVSVKERTRGDRHPPRARRPARQHPHAVPLRGGDGGAGRRRPRRGDGRGRRGADRHLISPMPRQHRPQGGPRRRPRLVRPRRGVRPLARALRGLPPPNRGAAP